MPARLSFVIKGQVVVFCACVSPVLSFTPSCVQSSALSPYFPQHAVNKYSASLPAHASGSSFPYTEAPVFPSATAVSKSTSNSTSSTPKFAKAGPRYTSAVAPPFTSRRAHDSTSSPHRNSSLLHSSPTEGSTWRDAGEISSLTSSTATPVFDIERIRQILPHRFPFLLVDKVLQFDEGKRAVGVKQVTANEDQFNGHFPARSILPGVLQVEALAQLAGIIALQPPISDGKGDFFFAGVNGVRWKKPVVPGDTLVMEVELTTWKEKLGIAKAKGKAFVDGKPAVEVEEMIFALVRPR